MIIVTMGPTAIGSTWAAYQCSYLERRWAPMMDFIGGDHNHDPNFYFNLIIPRLRYRSGLF